MTTMGDSVAADILPPETVRLLTEVGFLAAGRGMTEDAMTIMAGLKVLRPTRSAAYVGAALAHLNADRAEEAVRVLREEALPVVVDDVDTVRAFLALALKLDGRPRECAEELDRIAPDSADETALRMARSLREAL